MMTQCPIGFTKPLMNGVCHYKREEHSETIHECPLEIYPLFKERLKENMTSGAEGDNRCRKRRRDRDYFYRNDL